MSPTVLLREGSPELAVGSAGSNRIRSAILQTVVRVVEQGMGPQEAIDAPRLHAFGKTHRRRWRDGARIRNNHSRCKRRLRAALAK